MGIEKSVTSVTSVTNPVWLRIVECDRLKIKCHKSVTSVTWKFGKNRLILCVDAHIVQKRLIFRSVTEVSQAHYSQLPLDP